MWRICTGGRGGRPDSRRGSWGPAPKRDITPWELTTNGARQHPEDGGPGLAEASAGRGNESDWDSGTSLGSLSAGVDGTQVSSVVSYRTIDGGAVVGGERSSGERADFT